MPDEIAWTVTEPSGKVTTSRVVEKIPHVTKIQVPKDADENTKKFWLNYNLMQKTLIENGLMESK